MKRRTILKGLGLAVALMLGAHRLQEREEIVESGFDQNIVFDMKATDIKYTGDWVMIFTLADGTTHIYREKGPNEIIQPKSKLA